MTTTRTFRNAFHSTEATVKVRPDGTISLATARRLGRKLCPVSGCLCSGSSASGREMPDLEEVRVPFGQVGSGSLIGYRVLSTRQDESDADNELFAHLS